MTTLLHSLTVEITVFTAVDDTEVTGFLVTEKSAAPSTADPGWSTTAPASYTFGSAGDKTLYAWTRDAAGNISAQASDTVTIALADTSAPVIKRFAIPPISLSLTVRIRIFTAMDNELVTGYMATEEPIPPEADASGWTSTPPASYTFSTPGGKTLYAWAKDAAGNVSTALKKRSFVIKIFDKKEKRAVGNYAGLPEAEDTD